MPKSTKLATTGITQVLIAKLGEPKFAKALDALVLDDTLNSDDVRFEVSGMLKEEITDTIEAMRTAAKITDPDNRDLYEVVHDWWEPANGSDEQLVVLRKVYAAYKKLNPKKKTSRTARLRTENDIKKILDANPLPKGQKYDGEKDTASRALIREILNCAFEMLDSNNLLDSLKEATEVFELVALVRDRACADVALRSYQMSADFGDLTYEVARWIKAMNKPTPKKKTAKKGKAKTSKRK